MDADDEGILKFILRKRAYTFLSQGGLDIITDESVKKALFCINDFASIISESNVSQLKVIGTASLRKASNGDWLKQKFEKILNVNVEIISGQREAELIYKGVMLLPEMKKDTKLIMDIGGGSTEFIIVNNGEKVWSQSYTLGIGFLYSKVEHSDPITANEIKAVETYVLDELEDNFNNALMQWQPKTIVGASGSYEVLLSLQGLNYEIDSAVSLSLSQFDSTYEKIINSTLEERLSMPGLPNERAKLIVLAFVLKKIIIDVITPEGIFFSPYALKEGLMSEMVM